MIECNPKMCVKITWDSFVIEGMLFYCGILLFGSYLETIDLNGLCDGI